MIKAEYIYCEIGSFLIVKLQVFIKADKKNKILFWFAFKNNLISNFCLKKYNLVVNLAFGFFEMCLVYFYVFNFMNFLFTIKFIYTLFHIIHSTDISPHTFGPLADICVSGWNMYKSLLLIRFRANQLLLFCHMNIIMH